MPLVMDDFDQLGIPAADAALAVAIYTKLQEHYPGHHWRVMADHEQGFAAVFLQYFGGVVRYSEKYGYTAPKSDLPIESLAVGAKTAP
jgi:truncated hemoglobin YjbI